LQPAQALLAKDFQVDLAGPLQMFLAVAVAAVPVQQAVVLQQVKLEVLENPFRLQELLYFMAAVVVVPDIHHLINQVVLVVPAVVDKEQEIQIHHTVLQLVEQ
jgi:hypothetical protein